MRGKQCVPGVLLVALIADALRLRIGSKRPRRPLVLLTAHEARCLQSSRLIIPRRARRAVVVAEIKFRQIAMQVLFLAMLINAFHAALENRAVAPSTLRVARPWREEALDDRVVQRERVIFRRLHQDSCISRNLSGILAARSFDSE
jgi:hypothetical protein